MKNLFFLLILSLFTVSCQQDEFDTSKEILSYDKLIDSGKINIQENETIKKMSHNDVKTFFNTVLLKHGKPEGISSIEILNGELINSNETTILVAKSIDETIKVGAELVLMQDGSYNLNAKETVTCEGCTQGCNPGGSPGSWYCSSCEYNERCKKKVVKEFTPAPDDPGNPS